MPRLTKVLIANRGEIAVRVARACADEGIASVAVYAEDDRNAMHVRVADEAYSLEGQGAADTYLNIDKIIDVARRCGADSIHPGYGFMSESAAFAQAVTDAGLIWIGPSAHAIDALGDKVSARHIALRAGAPLIAGTPDPVSSVDEILQFADEHGVPIAIKAAFGGGGRGMRIAFAREDIPEMYDQAVNEAVAAFGRGECFVEQFLNHPRHVETQCLADTHGNVVVVSTRDCSLQRRNQKLVEEAPAPFVTEAQHARLIEASKAILREAGYTGAATCEFLLSTNGDISFLEVNTRLQVEHPVTEEVSGVDLVREQFRIAAGEALDIDDCPAHGHAIEFRINAEDPANGFLPNPGTITQLRLPGGPGVRLDFGYEVGDTQPMLFDSLLGKIIVWGADRQQAIERARRALREVKIVGVPTVLPFDEAVLRQPDFIAADGVFGVHTRWIETDFAPVLDKIASGVEEPSAGLAPAEEAPPATERVVVEVGGKRLEVVLPAGLGAGLAPRRGATSAAAPRRGLATAAAAATSENAVTAPMQGTIVKVSAAEGDHVDEGDLIVVLEAMKMEQPITAPHAGTIAGLTAKIGDRFTSGQAICEIH